MTFAIRPRQALTAAEAEAVRALVEDVAKRDGAPPLSDDALLRLDGDGCTHLLLRRTASAQLAGYAQMTNASVTHGSGTDESGTDESVIAGATVSGNGRSAGVVAEIVGDDGAVSLLLGELDKTAKPVTIWSHGNRSPVASSALLRGYRPVRVLWQLRRDLAEWIPPVLAPLPAGIVIRSFNPEPMQERGLLTVNAAAFTNHPEQGRWNLDDLHSRMAQPWFDPAGLLVAATPENEILGFHWTKSHPGQNGEVYVLAVSPKAQGLHLGAALLIAGLNHLASRGDHTVLLYVDDDNAAAMTLYERYGFDRFDCDTQLRHD